MRVPGPLLVLCLLFGAFPSMIGCESCVQPGDPDAGVDSGTGEGEGEGEGEGDLIDAGPACSEATPGFGQPCSQDGSFPQCGAFVCNPITDELVCADPGQNACGVCGDLDTTAGLPGRTCGEFGCGTAVCNADNTATECLDDHPGNACGGCETLFPEGATPGDACSGCGTGEQVCSTDFEELICFRGRESSNRCGGCGRCVLGWAEMDDRYEGGYVRAGTIALIEDVGGNFNTAMRVVFDPLVAGPGLDGLPQTSVFLSSGDDPGVSFAAQLLPEFASSLSGLRSDPHRTYTIPTFIDLNNFTHVVLYEASPFLLAPISVGVIQLGPPPFPLEGQPDAGTP